jgi:hypothetical protein
MSAAPANAPVAPRMKDTRLSSRYSWLGVSAVWDCRGKTAGIAVDDVGGV